VRRALNPERYEVILIGITREGCWRLGRGSEAGLDEVLKRGLPIAVSADPTHPHIIPLGKDVTEANQLPRLDVIFVALHGTFGEDGTVQGLLELAGIPYVGAGVLGSAAGMDKDVMKRLFRDAGLPVTPWLLVLRSEWEKSSKEVQKRIEQKLRYPFFVKPANLGSSVGITKVHGAAELAPAINVAAQYDRKILVEKAVNAREVEVSVLGNDYPEASIPGEIVPVNEFYDYEAKYLKPGSDLIIPARLTAKKAKRAQELAVEAFRATDCAGMARVDFLLDRKSGRFYVNEINSIPGFTPISMYPKLWEATGIPYSELLDRLVGLALERDEEKRRTSFLYRP
jgi:D-alanine-D-alanine ligase